MAPLSVIGVSHRTAPVEVRERLALPGADVGRMLRAMHAESDLEEALLLATCNRTELYSVPRRGHDPLEHFLDQLGRLRGARPAADPAVFYRYDGLEAARHLFRVAASLDSQIVGEHQILGQVKEAYRAAVEARTAGFLLNRALHGSFRVGKRVRTETELGRGSSGVAQAAVELTRQIFSSLAGKTVLLVGAGANAECAARALLRAGAARLIVANRTLCRAQQLAWDLVHKPAAKPGAGDEECDLAEDGEPTPPKQPLRLRRLEGPVQCPELPASGAVAADPSAATDAGAAGPATEAIGLEDIPAAMARADLVISSTDAPEPVLTLDGLAGVLGRRRQPVFIVDIAVPRDVDERLGRLEKVFLYNIDDLDRLVSRSLERRRREIPRAETIVEEEVARFDRWLSSLGVAPTIRLLTERLAALEQAHVARYGRKFTAADREQLDPFTRTLGNQFLHKPVEFLRSLSDGGETSESLAAVELVRRLFGLDESEDP
jgi:glutamyl-tRNA reductase